MVKPFYQGKLDTFCAIYAVLNALRLTHGIRVLKARDILNETLLALQARPSLQGRAGPGNRLSQSGGRHAAGAEPRLSPGGAQAFCPGGAAHSGRALAGLPGMARAGARPRGHFRFLRSLTPEARR